MKENSLAFPAIVDGASLETPAYNPKPTKDSLYANYKNSLAKLHQHRYKQSRFSSSVHTQGC